MLHPSLRHHQRRGEWVELQFMPHAASHGMVVSKPWGNSSRYDFIVENQGAFYRVQVKSTTYRQGRYYKCDVNTHNKPYTSEEVDFLACYVLPEDIWYIVPRSEAVRAKFAFFFDPYSRRSRYFRYLEAWHLLRPGPRARSGCPIGAPGSGDVSTASAENVSTVSTNVDTSLDTPGHPFGLALSMKAQLVRWGNSHAVRLPKRLLDAARLLPGEELQLTLTPAGAVEIAKSRND